MKPVFRLLFALAGILCVFASVCRARAGEVGGTAAQASDSGVPECRVRIQDYRQAIVLRQSSGKRLLIHADTACGDGPGRPLRLENVRMTIETDGRRFARVESAHGLYVSGARNRVLLDQLMGPIEPGCLGPRATSVLVDLDRKQFRSADGWALKLDASWAELSCLRAI